MRNTLLLMFLLLAAAPAVAAEKPAAIAKIIRASAPHGEGLFKRMWMKVYSASLWMDAKEWSMSVPFALNIHYFVEIEKNDLIDRTLQEMGNIEPMTENEREEYRNKLAMLYPKLFRGDNLTALNIPGKGMTLYYNGKPTGSDSDPGFVERFFGIWLSPKTSEPELREALLSGRAG